MRGDVFGPDERRAAGVCRSVEGVSSAARVDAGAVGGGDGGRQLHDLKFGADAELAVPSTVKKFAELEAKYERAAERELEELTGLS